jgi:hypothetical protein
MSRQFIQYAKVEGAKRIDHIRTQSTNRIIPALRLQARRLRQLWSPWLLLLVAGILPALIVPLYLNIWVGVHPHGTCDASTGIINGESWDPVGPGGVGFGISLGLTPSSAVAYVLTHRAFYTLNIIFGSYSFAAVKAIDVTWDLVVGRAGQFLLGLISYRVLADSLLAIMESDPVSYELYSAISISGSGVLSAAYLVKQFMCGSSWKHVCLLFPLALSLAWVLAWPTVMRAMTGYAAKEDLFIRLLNGDLVSEVNWENAFSTNLFQEIYDGQRIGLTKDYLVGMASQPELWNAIDNCTSHFPLTP